MFYYGIVAYDASGNRGLMSNIVSVTVIKNEDNEIIPKETSINTAPSTSLPQSSVLSEAFPVYVWAPLLAIVLIILFIGTIWTVYKHHCPSREYECDEDDHKSQEVAGSILSWSQHLDESRSTTTSAGVSTNLSGSMEDELSVDQKIDIWSSEASVSASGQQISWSQYGMEPRIHVMEDVTVYRDLSMIESDVLPSEYYCRLDQMLSVLLASRQQQHEEAASQQHNESLV